MFPCRSSEVRVRLVQEYDIKPIAHVRLLNGQERRSCTGDLLTDSYYCFSYRKKNSDVTGTFLCGTYAASHFLDLLHHPKLPLFDPLTSENVGTGSSSGSNDSDKKDAWHPAAKQLYNAINLLVICWGIAPGNALQDIKVKLEKYRGREPFLSQVKGINTIISRDKRGRTLRQMLDELRLNNNNIRDFDFNLLNVILKNNNIAPSSFGETL